MYGYPNIFQIMSASGMMDGSQRPSTGNALGSLASSVPAVQPDPFEYDREEARSLYASGGMDALVDRYGQQGVAGMADSLRGDGPRMQDAILGKYGVSRSDMELFRNAFSQPQQPMNTSSDASLSSNAGSVSPSRYGGYGQRRDMLSSLLGMGLGGYGGYGMMPMQMPYGGMMGMGLGGYGMPYGGYGMGYGMSYGSPYGGYSNPYGGYGGYSNPYYGGYGMNQPQSSSPQSYGSQSSPAWGSNPWGSSILPQQ